MEAQVFTMVSHNLRYFPTLIRACPQLCEFRVEVNPLSMIFHSTYPTRKEPNRLSFFIIPSIPSQYAGKCVGGRIKVIEIVGYIGCLSDNELVFGIVESRWRWQVD